MREMKAVYAQGMVHKSLLHCMGQVVKRTDSVKSRMAILRPASQTVPLARHRNEAAILPPKSICLGTVV